MRIALTIGIVAVLLVAVLLMPGAQPERPVAPESTPPPPASAPPAPTPDIDEIPAEELVRRAARAYIEAADEGRGEDVWEMMSEPAKNMFRELFDAGRGKASECLWVDFKSWARSTRAASYESPKALCAAMTRADSHKGSILKKVGDVEPVIAIDGNIATATWEKADERIALALEGGRWLFHSGARTYGGLEMVKTSSGREFPLWTWYEMRDVEQAYLDRWESRLPVIPGPKPANEDQPAGRDLHLFVDVTGRVTFRWREWNPEELIRELFVRADGSGRDMGDPFQPLSIPADLYLDRDMQATPFRDVLFTLTDPTVRFRHIFVPTKFGDQRAPREGREGVSLWITAVWLESVRVRVQDTAFDLVLSDLPETPGGADLIEMLSATDNDKRLDGVRVRIGPRTPVSRIVPVLVALGQVKDLRILLDLRSDDAPAAKSGIELDGAAVRLAEIEGELDPRVELEIRRP